jgi:hypothetical protein
MFTPPFPASGFCRARAVILGWLLAVLAPCEEAFAEGPIPEATLKSELSFIAFDTLIQRGPRLELFRKADFGDAHSPCYPCLTPQHVNCPTQCYQQATNLTLICSREVHGLSVGPFDRQERGRILADLMKTDSVLVATLRGEETLHARRISSQIGEDPSSENFGLDIEGFEGMRDVLWRATDPEIEQFQMRVGPYVLSTILQVGNRNKFYDFLKQCPAD